MVIAVPEAYGSAEVSLLVLRTITDGYRIEVMLTISVKLPDDLLAELEREAKARLVRPGRRQRSAFPGSKVQSGLNPVDCGGFQRFL
jgi:hypothetical protein